MKKKGIFLHQQTGETCGIACILMALTAFGKIRKPTPSLHDEKSAEEIFYDMYGFWLDENTRLGTLGSAIAYALACRRLDAELWHESEQLIENRGGYFPEALHAKMLRSHQDWITKANGAFCVRTGVRLDAQAVRGELAKDRLLILQCLVDGNADGMHDKVLHWILVFDEVNGHFRAYNPSYDRPSQTAPNYIELTAQELEAYMDTPVGASMISVGERT